MTDLKAKAPRLLSLDVFRGATIAAMILVNDPGDWSNIYPPLEHSKWNGCTPTDLVFPFFLFMVGVSIVYAMETKKQDLANHGAMIMKAFRRMITILSVSYLIQLFFHPNPGAFGCVAVVLITAGLLYVNQVGNNLMWGLSILATIAIAIIFFHSGLTTMRIPGVLQRISVVYFICTIFYLKTPKKAWPWLFAIALIGYYILMTFIPVPGVGYPNLEPETNLGAWIDRTILTTNHLWGESRTWDPEGILGTIPAIGTCLFGILVGTWLRRKDRDDSVKVTWMYVYGVFALVLALIWDLFFPINKALWSSSFVLYTGGLATMALATLYWLIDVQNHKKLTPFFVAYGTNAITAYILADFVPGFIGLINVHYKGHVTNLYSYLYSTCFVPFFSPINASLAAAIALVLLIWLIMWGLYKAKVVIKV